MAKAIPIPVVPHGGAPAGWLDFSANANPLGVPDSVRAAIASASYERYSDLDAAPAERHLAADAGVPRAATLVTSGATEALGLIAARHLGPGVRAVVAGPTYGEYGRLAQMWGARLEQVDAPSPRFRPPLEAIGRALRAPDTVVFVCDPNNPTGQQLTLSDYRTLLEVLEDRTPTSSLLVIDQSFSPFAADEPPNAQLVATRRVLLVRSLTKVIAAPGVRVGYVLGDAHLLRGLSIRRDPWPVGAHALAAASLAAWRLNRTARDLISAWRRKLAAGLRGRGFRPLQTATNFLLVEIGPAAANVAQGLAARHVAVRWCTDFGLPDHIRVAVRPPDEQAQLFDALDTVLATRRDQALVRTRNACRSIAGRTGKSKDRDGRPKQMTGPIEQHVGRGLGRNLNIGFLLFPRLTQLDLTGPFEALARIPNATVHLIADTLAPVASDVGLTLTPTVTMAACPPLDVLCIPGGPGVNDLLIDSDVLEFVRRQGAEARYVTSVCSGALVLGAAGLLVGYRATTHWASLDFLARLGAMPVKTRVCIDRNRVTGGGVTAGIDFGLYLAAELADKQTAERIQLYLEYAPEPPFAAGSPDSAPADVAAAYAELAAPMLRQRADRVAEAAARLGTVGEPMRTSAEGR